MTSSRYPTGALVPVLALLFCLSGAAALVYQLLWLRLLGLVFGVTVHAASTVLAAFMSGLALGSFVAGRLAHRARRPLVWFAVIEALIAITALGTPLMLRALQGLYGAVYAGLPDTIPVVTAARFAIAFAALIVPTALMGTTLPIVMKSALLREGAVGQRFGVLYAANTSGAIVGTLLAGLLLIPSLGIRLTFVVAATANILVAVVALVYGWRLVAAPAPPFQGSPVPPLPGSPVPPLPGSPVPPLPGSPVPPLPGSPVPRFPGSPASRGTPAWRDSPVRKVVLAVFVLSGFASLALEVLWFRVNVLVLRPTAYAFAMMLGTVLAGIALGSAAIAPFLKRRWDWVTVLAVTEILIAAAALLSFRALEAAPPVVEWAVPRLGFMPQYLVPLLVISLLTIFPALFLLGVAFPIGLQLWAGGPDTPPDLAARRLGVFYALNVCGGIAGSIAAGFLFLPLFGSRTTLLAMCGVVAGSGLLLLAVHRAPRWRRILPAVAGLALLASIPVPDPFAVFLEQRFPNQPILWRQEGVQTTVSVHELGPGGRRVMYLDGLHQASTAGSMVFVHRRLGHLPMALHSRAGDVLVVGLGGGATAGAVSRYPFANVEIVELSESVVEAAAFFEEVNYGLLHRPNVRVRVDDGRNHLLLRRRTYDVITADLIVPLHAGAGNVYSADYFRLVRRALRPGGLVAQWVSGTEAEYKLIMRTFLSVFPHATLWGDGTVMVAGLEPLRVSSGDIGWKLAIPETREALAQIGVESVDDVRGMYTAGPEEMRAFVGEGPMLTDDRPAIEYFLALPREPLDISGLRGDVSAVIR